MNRALRAATLGVALLFPVTLSACSAGQVTQTATQDRDQTGSMARVGSIELRQVQLLYPPRGTSYDAGDDADLRVSIVNSGQEADRLVSVEGEGFASAELSGDTTRAALAGRPLGSVPVVESNGIELPARSTVFVGEDDVTITLTDLEESLTVGQYLTLVFTFENAGEVTVRATVDTPDEEVRRGQSFDFHEEEGEGTESGEEIARERESDVGD
ncbi:copper chaperone PCu(A)C [Blastococcus sp. CCUG 61487]|uniref:copper chaperone PCu(A)C n=1 Tax=Blastococcus sp. CCUG 61487 TaxID=1840703 RepID=UPI0010C05133|nr:copper chaperone PCu(A)C [Blastococcus sp. CCUG 61487]TKJ20018.1 hypothetical protein A6V29_09435 [Blastococcus sp. CCUG 61487]